MPSTTVFWRRELHRGPFLILNLPALILIWSTNFIKPQRLRFVFFFFLPFLAFSAMRNERKETLKQNKHNLSKTSSKSKNLYSLPPISLRKATTLCKSQRNIKCGTLLFYCRILSLWSQAITICCLKFRKRFLNFQQFARIRLSFGFRSTVPAPPPFFFFFFFKAKLI